MNGREQELAPGETVATLLARLGLEAGYALVERNGEPVERAPLRGGRARGRRHAGCRPPRCWRIGASTSSRRSRPDFAAFLEAAIRGGVDVVQVRDRSLSDGRLLDALAEARGRDGGARVPLGVNDRPTWPSSRVPTSSTWARTTSPSRQRGFGLPVGLSTHAPEEIDGASSDYIAVGPVHATPTKEGRPAVGLELVRYAAAQREAAMVRNRRHR